MDPVPADEPARIRNVLKQTLFDPTEAAQVVSLENGLCLILLEDHSAPVVSVQAWCRTGSVHEGAWLGGGLSHVLEHMLFKGTERRKPGQIDREVQDAGGYMNAYTSFDRTVYWINTPSKGASVAVDVLADIMQRATLPEDEFVKEMDVIRREMDMGMDDPGRRSSRRLFEIAYTTSPYRQSIIGHPEIFNQLTRQDVLDYYKARYAPNNCFFVVVGDFDAARIEDELRTHYQGTLARPLAPVYLPEEPRQTGPRRLVEESSIELVHLHVAWHTPGLRHPDAPSLDVISTVLGTGRSSRLYQELREKSGSVHSVDAWTYAPGATGLFGMSAVTDASRLLQAESELSRELDRLRSDLVGENELERVRNQYSAGFLSNRKTMQGQAQDLGANWLTTGDLGFSGRYLEEAKRVTPETLREAARRHLPDICKTTYALAPRGVASASVRAQKTATSAKIQICTLSNGLRVITREDRRLPFVDARLLFAGGVLAETEAANGASLLASKLLLKGTHSRSAKQIAEEIEGLGGSLESYSANNSLGLSLEVLSHEQKKGLELLTDCALNAIFPQESLDRERSVQLASIEAQKDQLLQLTFKDLRRSLFGNAGYGLDPLGTSDSLTALDPRQLRDHYHRLGVGKNGVIAVFGDFETPSMLALLEKGFEKMASGNPATVSGKPAPENQTRRNDRTRDKKQAVVVVGFRGCSMHDPARHALDLIQEACSDMGSRLFVRIREKLGLAYYVGSQNFSGLGAGFFAFYAGTSPEHAAKVEAELLVEAMALGREGLDEAELARAKSKLMGHRQIAHQDPGSLAMTVALDELFGHGYDYHQREVDRYNAVTLEDIKSCAARWLDPRQAFVAITHP